MLKIHWEYFIERNFIWKVRAAETRRGAETIVWGTAKVKEYEQAISEQF